MDAERVNQLSRSVAALTRRGGLRLLTAGVLGSLLVRLGLSPTVASHGCRHLGKPCTKSKQCCTGARCKNGKCRCKAIYFECGTLCCPDGSDCGTLPLPGEPKFCDFGDKQPGQGCDPTQPGECASGICTPQVPGGTGFCREADCQAVQGLCEGYPECCEGDCWEADAFCGGGARCCRVVRAPCQEDCDCCGFPDVVCRKGTCCRPEFASCPSASKCCGSLVCNNNLCVKP